MSDGKKFLLRKATGETPVDSAGEIREWLQRGQVKAADFVFDFSAQKWSRVGELPFLLESFGPKPSALPEKRLVYFMPAGGSAVPQGPFSTKEIAQRIQARELCAVSWVFVDGDKEWRPLRAIKVLADLLPALPKDIPPPPAPAPAAPLAAPAEEFSFDLSALQPAASGERQTNPSIRIEMDEEGFASPAAPPRTAPHSGPAVYTPPPPTFTPAPAAALADVREADAAEGPALDDDFPEREDATMAISTLGLSLAESPPPAPTPPPAARRPGGPPAAPPAGPAASVSGGPSAGPSAGPPKTPPAGAPGAPPNGPPRAPGAAASPPRAPSPGPGAAANKDMDFDGITAEIPVEPIWLVKPGNSEAVSGPFRFLEVVKFLEEGRLTKNDKISKIGTNRFVKILQQYEFNVKFTLENVVEHGVEKQKILIKRRHPRVPYITTVQVVGRPGVLTGTCINISAGGILVELAKGELATNETVELKLLPGLIQRTISCKALVTGKIAKIPPGFALQFEDLKNDDKEAIEYFVQEALKREMS